MCEIYSIHKLLECGRARTKPTEGGQGRISSGREAPVGSAPWHAILREVRQVSNHTNPQYIMIVISQLYLCILQGFSSFSYIFVMIQMYIT